MLGVIIGVAAVILLVAIGQGVQNDITGQIESIGSNLLFVLPGNFEGGGGGGAGGPGVTIRKPFKMADAETLQRRLPRDVIVVPVVQAQGLIKFGNRSTRATLSGADQNGPSVFNSSFAEGRHYNRSEFLAGARVAMIGQTVKKKLFPNLDPVGREIIINGQRFRVIGLLNSLGGGLGGDQDNQVFIPTTTAQNLLGTNQLSSIIAKAPTADSIQQVKTEITRILKPRFGSEFTVFTQQQTLGILSTLLGTLTGVLAGIAAISLLVGGIGIMNIMLVSVSERTREIGIRKAVGARTFDVLAQFVIEAVMLSVLGGVIGIIVGAGGSWLLDTFTPVPAQVTWWAVVLAFGFAAAVGVFFGVYPAWKASRMDPIQALRYE
jgi:putative ABC transport system permease protein